MHHNTGFRRTAVIAATVTLVSSGCTNQPGTSMSGATQVAASCPTNARIASLIASDESRSRRGSTRGSAQLGVIRKVAQRTAICGGHLRVTLFSGSMIGITVFDGDLQLDGATDKARLRKAPEVVDGVMDRLNAELPDATAQLNDGATDIVGQYQQGSDYQAQLAASGMVHLEQTILTDGIQTAGQDLSNTDLTDAEATTLAATFVVPRLSDAQVRLIGIGRQVDDAPLPTPYIDALRAFHSAVCERTGAQCMVVTDAAGA